MKAIKQNLKYIFLAISFFLIFLYLEGNISTVHELCPFASICFGPWLFNSFVGKIIFPIAIILGLLIAVNTIFFGRFFCGNVCPIGTIQHMLFYRKKKINIPIKLHQFLRKFKYVVLIFIILAVIFTFQHLYLGLCPIFSIVNFKGLTIGSIIFFSLLIIFSIFVNRFWCNYICPYGALMNFFQGIGRLLKIKKMKNLRNLEVCIDCNLCVKECPMRINITEKETNKSIDCIHCEICDKKCPKGNCFEKKW